MIALGVIGISIVMFLLILFAALAPQEQSIKRKIEISEIKRSHDIYCDINAVKRCGIERTIAPKKISKKSPSILKTIERAPNRDPMSSLNDLGRATGFGPLW